MPKLALLTEDAAGAVDTAKWPSRSGYTHVDGKMNFAVPGAAGSQSHAESVFEWDLLSSEVLWEIPQWPGGTNYVWLGRLYATSGDFTTYIQIRYQQSTGASSLAEVIANVVQGTVSTPALNATDHRWLRIRESGGTLHWEAAPDGTTWSSLKSQARGMSDTQISAMRFALVFQWQSATTPAPTSAWQVDNVNLAPATGFLDAAATLTGAGDIVASPVPPQTILPDADLATTGWSTAPLHSKVSDASDATVISATAS